MLQIVLARSADDLVETMPQIAHALTVDDSAANMLQIVHVPYAVVSVATTHLIVPVQNVDVSDKCI